MFDPKRRLVLRAMAGTVAATAFTAGLATRSHAATHTVTIRNFAFEPANLTIAAGDTVTFVNADSAPHTATANSGAFDTKRLENGQSAALRFTGAGTHDYFCAIHHPRMKGRIVVQ